MTRRVQRPKCPAPRPAARRPLPTRRGHDGLEFEHDGHCYHLGIGRYPDGTIGEIFLSTTVKASSALNALARDVAIALSVGFQCGVSPAMFRAAVQRQPDGAPASLLGAVLDHVAEVCS